jgi:hypothetical protein
MLNYARPLETVQLGPIGTKPDNPNLCFLLDKEAQHYIPWDT